MATRKRRTRHVTRKRARESDPVVILLVLAKALNEAEKAGIRPRMRHGIIWTDAGYVLPKDNDKWAARPLKKYR